MNHPARSKFFSVTLESLLQSRGITQAELGERCAIAVSRINNYLHGRYGTVKPSHLAAIYEALGGSAAEKAVLAEAFLLDLISEECRRWVEIRRLGAKEAGRWQLPTRGLPPDFAAAFKDLYSLCVSNVKVRHRTREWIALMREITA